MYVRGVRAGGQLREWWVGAWVERLGTRSATLARYNRSGRVTRRVVRLTEVVLAEPAPKGVPWTALHKERGGMGMRNFPAAVAARSTTL